MNFATVAFEHFLRHRLDNGSLARLHRCLYRQLSERGGLPFATRDVGRMETLTLPKM